MGASLDPSVKRVALLTTIFFTFICLFFLILGKFHAQKIEKRFQDAKISKPKNSVILTLWIGSFLTLLLMAVATALVTSQITSIEIDDEGSTPLTAKVTSSINFCEVDFEHTPYIAEPANSISSMLSYVTLALLGLFGPPSKQYKCNNQKLQFISMYVSLLFIGLGSTALHARLTAESQAGDELPMLWYSAAVALCSVDVILFHCYAAEDGGNEPGCRYANLAGWLNNSVSFSVVAATAVYVNGRANFLVFYIILMAYVFMILFALGSIGLLLDWTSKDLYQPKNSERRKFVGETFLLTVLFPFLKIMGMMSIVGTWLWATEMIGCDGIMNQYKYNNGIANESIAPGIFQNIDEDDSIGRTLLFIVDRFVRPAWQYIATTCFHSLHFNIANDSLGQMAVFIMNRVVHSSWHFLSALFAWLLIQALTAAKGFQRGWGEPVIQWYGAPYVLFLSVNK